MKSNNIGLRKLFIALLLALVFIPSSEAYAKRTTLRTGTVKLDQKYGDFPKTTFSVHTKTKSTLMISVTIKDVQYDDSTGRGKLWFRLYDSDGNLIQNDPFTMKGAHHEDQVNYWFYNDDLLIPKGTYYYQILNKSSHNVSIKYKIFSFTKCATKLKLSKTATLAGGEWKKIGSMPKDSLPHAKQVKIGNTAIVSSCDIESDGSIWVYGERRGTTTVKIKLINGKKYKCKVTVTPTPYPNFFAAVIGYYTRDNYFLVNYER